MSGICSAHRHREPGCPRCAVGVTADSLAVITHAEELREIATVIVGENTHEGRVLVALADAIPALVERLEQAEAALRRISDLGGRVHSWDEYRALSLNLAEIAGAALASIPKEEAKG